MSAFAMNSLTRCLARLAGVPAGDLADAELLDRFRRGGEEAAFALLVQRHGPVVLGVCRRLLGNSADADDAFQATFLVLIRKAGSIRRSASLGSWLYGVASHVAARTRSRRLVVVPPDFGLLCSGPQPSEEAAYRELAALLDREILVLPARQRG